MSKFFSSPKTTWAAIFGFISLALTQGGFLLDADPTTIPDWGMVLTGLITLFGLLFARDNNVNSELEGASPIGTQLTINEIEKIKKIINIKK